MEPQRVAIAVIFVLALLVIAGALFARGEFGTGLLTLAVAGGFAMPIWGKSR